MARYQSRIPIVDRNHPESWGKDDITGLPVMHNDMIKQMEFGRGGSGGLGWTGFMVHYKDADQPNPQLMPVRVPPDPIPIPNPRILQFIELPPIPSGIVINTVAPTTITLTWTVVPIAQTYVVGWTSIWSYGESGYLNGLTYTITNLSPGNTYLIGVASSNAQGQSAFSEPLSVTTG